MTEARTYMDGYSDGKEWAQADMLRTIKELQASLAWITEYIRAAPPELEEAKKWLLVMDNAAAGASPAVVTATKPLTYAQAHLLGFTCTKVEDASGKERLTIYKTKLGAHSEHQLYDDEALALWINIGKALGPEYTGASPVQPSQEWTPALSPATISTAPACLNTNDKAMWVLGWNECLNAQPPAPSDTAITYMTGYSDGREWAAAPIPQQPSVPEGWKQAVALAYGHLWHVNNEPMAPIPLRSSETAAYEARKQLRDLLTHEERGLAINRVQAMLSAAPQPKETK